MVIFIEFGISCLLVKMHLRGIKLFKGLISLNLHAFPGYVTGTDAKDRFARLARTLLIMKNVYIILYFEINIYLF